MSITLTAAYTPNVIANITTPGKKEYCQRHGYQHHIEVCNFDIPQWEKDNQISYGFYRILFLLKICQKYPFGDWLVWTDCDAMIMNHTITLDAFIDDSYDLIIGEDWNGINTGVFFLQISRDSVKFLQNVLNFQPSDEVKAKYPDWWTRSEQCAIYCLRDTVRTKVVHHALFNGYPFGPMWCNDWRHKGLGPTIEGWQPRLFQVGDFMLHVASGDLGYKMQFFNALSDKVIK